MSGGGLDPALIGTLYRAACLAELDALKPGNVHAHAPGHRMVLADFVTSADVSAPALARAGAGVGTRVRDGVAATMAAVGQNTNLGILLLCAPLAVAQTGVNSSFDKKTLVRGVQSRFAQKPYSKPVHRYQRYQTWGGGKNFVAIVDDVDHDDADLEHAVAVGTQSARLDVDDGEALAGEQGGRISHGGTSSRGTGPGRSSRARA